MQKMFEIFKSHGVVEARHRVYIYMDGQSLVVKFLIQQILFI